MGFTSRALRRRGHLRGQKQLPPLVAGVDRIEALSLPVRLALLEHVRLQGPATATETGAALGLSPAAASYHLRVLAEHGFVAETSDDPDRRKRRWRATTTPMTVDPTAGETLAETQALDRLEATFFEHAAHLFATYLEQRHEYPDAWRRAASSVQDTLMLTPMQLDRLRSDLIRLLERYRRRSASQRGAAPVFIAFNAVPRRPPATAHRNSDQAQSIPSAEEVKTL